MASFSVIGSKVSSDDGKTIIKNLDTKEWDNTTYTNTNLPSTSECIYIWCIKINRGHNIRLGISSGQQKTNICVAQSKGRKICAGKKEYYGDVFSEGDVIKIRLDLIQHELLFYKNNINQGIAYKHIKYGDNVNYNLAVSLKKKNCCVTLLDFKKYGDLTEQKQSIDILKVKQKESYFENEQLIAKNKDLMNKIEQLQNEQKENEMLIKEMKQQIEKFRMQTMDLSQYQSWSHDDVFTWIISLESGRYKSYQDKLKKNLEIQKIRGEDLKSMNSSDIIDLGIVGFQDKKALLSSIQQLINQNKASEEGDKSQHEMW